MRHTTGDLWDTWADAYVIPTNGVTRNDGTAVMGAGLARQAATKFPKLDRELGERLRTTGNHVYHFTMDDQNLHATTLITFPTKDHWRENSDLELIDRSARELLALTNYHNYIMVVLPAVGCGLGALSWDEVGPVLSQRLDDRFLVVFRS